MAVTRAPKRAAPVVASASEPDANEQAVLEVIQRGGTVQADQMGTSSQPPMTDALKNVQLRIYQTTLDEIDAVRQQQARGRRPASRHAWIIAAIEEKLEREHQK